MRVYNTYNTLDRPFQLMSLGAMRQIFHVHEDDNQMKVTKTSLCNHFVNTCA